MSAGGHCERCGVVTLAGLIGTPAATWKHICEEFSSNEVTRPVGALCPLCGISEFSPRVNSRTSAFIGAPTPEAATLTSRTQSPRAVIAVDLAGVKTSALANPPTPPVTITVGSLDSDEKGTAARANGGKPDLALIPLKVLSMALRERKDGAKDGRDHVLNALFNLGNFQATGDCKWLRQVIRDLEQLDFHEWEQCAAVFTYGASKYKAWNWAKGFDWSVVVASAARHLVEMVLDPMSLDPESKLPHRGHVMCNVVMLLQFAVTWPSGNDLPKGLL